MSDAISLVVVMILGAGLMAVVPGFANSIAATNIGIGAIASRSAGHPGAAVDSFDQRQVWIASGSDGRRPILNRLRSSL